jgi:hypothetical protein
MRDTPAMRLRRHAALVVLLPGLLGAGPCGPIAGGRLDGSTSAAPADWRFTDGVSTIQVETRPEDPYSVTTWCFSDGTGLYVPSRSAARKPWVQNVLADPRVRLRIEDRVFEMTASRVTDAAELRRVIPLLRAKYRMARWGMDDDPASAPGTWFFRMTPR